MAIVDQQKFLVKGFSLTKKTQLHLVMLQHVSIANPPSQTVPTEETFLT